MSDKKQCQNCGYVYYTDSKVGCNRCSLWIGMTGSPAPLPNWESESEWRDLIKKLQLKEDYAFPFFYEIFWLIIRESILEKPKSEWDNSPLAKWVGNGFGWAKFKIDSFK